MAGGWYFLIFSTLGTIIWVKLSLIIQNAICHLLFVDARSINWKETKLLSGIEAYGNLLLPLLLCSSSSFSSSSSLLLFKLTFVPQIL
jgi:hypothetical protein